MITSAVDCLLSFQAW